MLGLGEEWAEILTVMQDLADCEVDILTIGQYLRPSKKHLPIERYYRPEAFVELKRIGVEMGFKWVESGPLVRSSYRAEEQVRVLSKMGRLG
jgi:lipoic acid synthetase